MERFLLINPGCRYYLRTYRSSMYGSIGLPLGLLYIAAILKKKGCQVKILDSLASRFAAFKQEKGHIFYGIPQEAMKNQIQDFNPDIVGISSQFMAQEDEVYKVAQLIKELNSSTEVWLGGANVSSRAYPLMNNSNIDIAVVSEGEKTVGECIDSYRSNKAPEQVKGIFYKKGKCIVETGAQDYIKNIDDIPFPAYEQVDMEIYLTLYKRGIYSRDRDVKRSIPMVTSRGCPHHCIFCSVSKSMGRLWRPHSAEYIVDHIKYVACKYMVKHIHFEDDNLLLDINRFLPVIRALEEKCISWDTPNGIYMDLSLDKQILREMKRSGCKYLSIGVESGDENTLHNIIRKKIKLSDVEEFAKRCKETSLPLRAFFILGFPGETLENMKRTVRFAMHLANEYGVEIVNLIATPLFGTELYNICKQHEYFRESITPQSLSESTVSDGRCLIQTEEFSSEEVERLSKLLTARAYCAILLRRGLMHPLSLLKRLGNLYTLKRTLQRIMYSAFKI